MITKDSKNQKVFPPLGNSFVCSENPNQRVLLSNNLNLNDENKTETVPTIELNENLDQSSIDEEEKQQKCFEKLLEQQHQELIIHQQQLQQQIKIQSEMKPITGKHQDLIILQQQLQQQIKIQSEMKPITRLILQGDSQEGCSNMMDDNDIKVENTMGDGESPYRKLYQTNKKRTVRRKEKKARQNRRLRKMLKPKTALMTLNELKGTLSHYKIRAQGNNFIAEICVNDNRYEGCGTSKVAAKNNASEKALRDLIILKMSRMPKQDVNVTQSNSNKGSSEDINMDSDDIKNESGNEDENEDDVPMLHLASFALHKLFTEWESQGFSIPDFKAPIIGIEDLTQSEVTQELQSIEKLLTPARIELPPNAETLHPCNLLAIMRPGITFNELGSEGLPPNITHKVGVIVDGKEFTGEARSKRLARKLVASLACTEIFKVVYPPEENIV